MIVSGGTGGIVSFWKINNTAQSLKYRGTVRHLCGHDGPVNCLAACKPYSIVVTGSSDKTAIIWDTNRYIHCMCCHLISICVSCVCSPEYNSLIDIINPRRMRKGCVYVKSLLASFRVYTTSQTYQIVSR